MIQDTEAEPAGSYEVKKFYSNKKCVIKSEVKIK